MTRRTHTLVLALLILCGLAQIASTYRDGTPTYDEPAQVAAGLELLQYGTYTYEYQAPPLSRVMVALGPYLAGARLPAHRDIDRDGINILFQDGNAALASGAGYDRNLLYARLGALPFFVLLCVLTAMWAHESQEKTHAIAAVAFLILFPPLIGHAGLATLDVAGAAGMLAALYAVTLWYDDPSTRRSLWLGGAIALALMTKLSSLAFLPVCFAAGWFLNRRRFPLQSFAIAKLSALVLVWICYACSIHTLASVWGPHPRLDAYFDEHTSLASLWNTVANIPLPLTELVLSIRDVLRHNAIGHDAYLLGEYSRTGWWYFFPVVIAVKTPLVFLLFAIAGFVCCFRSRQAIFAVGILAVAMASSIDLGVRHIFAIYPLLAILAARAVHRLRRFQIAIAALFLTLVSGSIASRPDPLAYFNEFAFGHPEKILVESDLDWGQDLHRLATRLEQLRVPSVAIAYFGSAELERAGLPPHTDLDPAHPMTGYIAISLHRLYLDHARDGSYDWVTKLTPRERIGNSIELFYVSE